MKDKYLVLTAQVISMLFSPFYLPVVALIALFMFSYLSMLPLFYKLFLLGLVYIFTVVLPRLAIFCYRHVKGWTRHQLSRRERRYVPYILSITCYALLLYVLYSLHTRFLQGIIVGALAVQVVCALLNGLTKMSTHAAASGAVVGALLAYSQIFLFDPTGWLCLTVILAGAVGTSRLILRQHTLTQIGISTFVGFACGFACILIC